MSYNDNFDYENAKRDILDAGGDPDYLDHYDPEKRDSFMKDMGFNPKDYGSKYGSSNSSSSGSSSSSSSGTSGCYLTSACVKAADLPDDCEELMTLRNFRDTYIKNCPTGKEDIEEYYEIAPKIVKAINESNDSDYIWKMIYNNLILRCVDMIKSGRYSETYELYKLYTLKLKAEYVPA